jgi:endonuclease/exonuclease/phosphatase family metal-dependent hydrolase
MKILSLNCQRGYHSHLPLREFLQRIFVAGEYDFILLQEFAKNVPSFVRGVGPYQLLEAHNDEVGEAAQLCVAYRREYDLLGSSFEAFATKGPDPIVGAVHSTFGSLCGRFTGQDTIIVVGSMHLHAGVHRGERKRQIQTIKKQLLTLRVPGDSVIVGGDCNLGPLEHRGVAHLLEPEFSWATSDLPPTLDGKYSENVSRLPNRIGAVLRFFGIPARLWTDQIFVDAATAAVTRLECSVLPDRVSDHSPVELELVRLEACSRYPCWLRRESASGPCDNSLGQLQD